MDFFAWLPTPALWAALALTAPLVAVATRYLAFALGRGEFNLFGRTIADRATSPTQFWTLYANGVLACGWGVFVLISVLVELFLVRA